MPDRHLDLVLRLQALARTGLHFCGSEYNRQRYEEIERIAASAAGASSRRWARPRSRNGRSKSAGPASQRPTWSARRRFPSAAARWPATSCAGCRPSSPSSRWRRRASRWPSRRPIPRRPRARPSGPSRASSALEFLLSPNPGEELRPLARIASGGELSRLMLALKSVVRADARGLTLVFDEVDAGIGGRVAEVVGRKLRLVGEQQQVLCVTHLPQIAALADHHLAVRKQVTRGRTLTEVDALSEDARVEEVARMLGGETVTATARMHAREMLKESLRR